VRRLGCEERGWPGRRAIGLVARGRFPFPARQANDDGYLAL